MRKEESFGIIPLRRRGEAWEILLVCHRAGRYWGFPKGHAESGESAEQTACRELFEETGLTWVSFLPLAPFKETYRFSRKEQEIEKRVTYFAALVEGEVRIQEMEIADAAWISLEEAVTLATFPGVREICRDLVPQLINFRDEFRA